MEDGLTIGSKVFAVHNKHVNKNINGAKVVPCRVKTFENRHGKIQPVLTVIGNTRQIVDPLLYKTYVELSKAIDAIR